MGKFVQCIPGSGKTWLAWHEDGFVDSDDVLAAYGLEGEAGYRAVLDNPRLKKAVVADLNEAAEDNTVLCNFDPDSLGLATTARYAYRVGDYVEHLTIAGRDDLLTSFSSDTLKGWTKDYESKRNVTWLRPGEYIASVICNNQKCKL